MRKITFILVLLSVSFSFGQNISKIDSLKRELGKSINRDLHIYYIIGREYNNKGNYEKALLFLNNGLKFNTDSLTNEQQLGYHEELADVFLNQKKNTLALKHINISDSIYNIIKDPLNVNHPYNLKSIILRRFGDYEGAIKSGLKSLKIAEKKKNYALVAASYNSIGILQEKLNNNSNAETYYLKGIAAIKMDTLYSVTIHNNFNGNLYMNLGNSLMGQNKNKKAILNYKKAIHYFNLLNNQHRLSYVYNNISSLKNIEKQYDSAIYFAKKSLTIKLKNKSKKDLITNYLNLSEGYRNLNHIQKAYKYALLQAEILNKSKVESNNKLLSFFDISKTFKKNKKYYLSLEYLEKYISLNDSIMNLKKTNRIKELEIKYQTQQKENKILQLNNQNLIKDIEIKKQNNLIIGVLSVFTVSLGMFFFIWYKRIQKHKQLLLKTAIEASEQEKIAIGKDLHDGVASSIIKLVHQVEDTNMDLSHQLLKTYHQVRDLSHQLNNTPLHNELLLERLIEIIPDERNNQIFELQIKPSSLKLNEPTGTHIYRIIQELITNNLKYAKASKTNISIKIENNNLILSYTDNGIGITNLNKKTGLKNIEDRVQLLNGKINWNTKPNNGFGIEIQIPYEG